MGKVSPIRNRSVGANIVSDQVFVGRVGDIQRFFIRTENDAFRDAINKLPSAALTMPSAPSFVTQMSFMGVPAATTPGIAAAGGVFSAGTECCAWPRAKAAPETHDRIVSIRIILIWNQSPKT